MLRLGLIAAVIATVATPAVLSAERAPLDKRLRGAEKACLKALRQVIKPGDPCTGGWSDRRAVYSSCRRILLIAHSARKNGYIKWATFSHVFSHMLQGLEDYWRAGIYCKRCSRSHREEGAECVLPQPTWKHPEWEGTAIIPRNYTDPIGKGWREWSSVRDPGREVFLKVDSDDYCKEPCSCCGILPQDPRTYKSNNWRLLRSCKRCKRSMGRSQ